MARTNAGHALSTRTTGDTIITGITEDTLPTRATEDTLITQDVEGLLPRQDQADLAGLPPPYEYQGRISPSYVNVLGIIDKLLPSLPILSIEHPTIAWHIKNILRDGCFDVAMAMMLCNNGDYTEEKRGQVEMTRRDVSKTISLVSEAAILSDRSIAMAIIAANTLTAVAYEVAKGRHVSRQNAACIAVAAHTTVYQLSGSMREGRNLHGSAAQHFPHGV